mmetsp:Transcript_123195/g.217196  ORF Transcript_123195/g.217196 Transcript_123195/m.217196 type:complete len:270 (-) Transcript_123195:1-810(-)
MAGPSTSYHDRHLMIWSIHFTALSGADAIIGKHSRHTCCTLSRAALWVESPACAPGRHRSEGGRRCNHLNEECVVASLKPCLMLRSPRSSSTDCRTGSSGDFESLDSQLLRRPASNCLERRKRVLSKFRSVPASCSAKSSCCEASASSLFMESCSYWCTTGGSASPAGTSAPAAASGIVAGTVSASSSTGANAACDAALNLLSRMKSDVLIARLGLFGGGPGCWPVCSCWAPTSASILQAAPPCGGEECAPRFYASRAQALTKECKFPT